MKIAPIDIAHKVFSKKFTGVDPEEVSMFLREVADEMEAIIRERNSLKEQIREREIQLLEFKERDKSLKETIMTAHKMTENLRKDGEREAALILNDAQQRADAIVRDARDSLQRTFAEITELRKQKTQFETAMRNLVSAHLELIERNNGLIPHVGMGQDPTVGAATPNMRKGRPIVES